MDGTTDTAVLRPFIAAGDGYVPRPVRGFRPDRIVLAKGSMASAQRRRFVDAIRALYPAAEVLECFETPHNRIELGETDPLRLHYRGKRTLVFGEHASAVRSSDEDGNACPNYWHFSPYGFCPFDCTYCYLAGTPGVKFSPTVKTYVNLPEIVATIDRVATRLARPTPFYLGKLQDGLALDPLTGYSRTLVPFFARHPYARQTLLTKSADVENLLDLDHGGHTILSWSLNPPDVCHQFEAGTPSVHERIEAMRRSADVGYPVRAVVMPIIPITDWPNAYRRFLTHLLQRVPLDRLTLGGICSYQAALRLTQQKLGRDNAICRALAAGRSPDGRRRFPVESRLELYRDLIATVRRCRPELPIGLCLEEHAVFAALGMTHRIGSCNCVL